MMKDLKMISCFAVSALAVASPSFGQNAAPSPPSPAAGATIQLPPYEVIGEKPEWGAMRQSFETLNHAFDGPFPELRSGPLIEAILWRHRYLAEHPSDDAIILTAQD